MVIEAGLGAVTVQGAAEFWEDNIMTAFYDEGHIVSNAHRKRIKKFPVEEIPVEALRDLQEASEGGAEYFILALICYDDSVVGVARPETISLRLYRISPYGLLFEEYVSKGQSTSLDDALKNTKGAIKTMFSHMRSGW
jgi:hypothetical protein